MFLLTKLPTTVLEQYRNSSDVLEHNSILIQISAVDCLKDFVKDTLLNTNKVFGMYFI